MPEHLHYDEEDLFNPETRHEETDVPVRPLFIFLIIVVVTAVLMHVALLAMYKGLVNLERNRAESPFSAVAKPASESIPRGELLQPFPRKATTGEVLPPHRNTPVTDMNDMLHAQNEVLRSYDWVDREKGVVRIPIALAKELMLQRAAAQAPATVPALTTSTGTAPAPPQASAPVSNDAVTTTRIVPPTPAPAPARSAGAQ